LADRIAGALLSVVLSSPEFQESTWAAAKASGEYRSGGPREVKITFLGGGKQKFKVPYLKRDLRGRRGRRRKIGKRGAGGTGIYPMLAALGVIFGVTPALAAEITRQVTDSDSVRSGREALRRRGIDLGHKQTLRIVNHVGQTALGVIPKRGHG
jgi:hypothetical protein